MPERVERPNGFRIDPRQLRRLGQGLTRPECVLCTAQGVILVSHFQGGITRIGPDGTQRDILGHGEPCIATNGFAVTQTGDLLCANLLPPGGVWQLSTSGRQTPFLLEIDGVALPSVNFVYVDRLGRTWITISTRREPREHGYRPDVDDGFIILVDRRGHAKIVADGLGYTNEAKVDPSGRWLYVNETFGRRTSRFPIHDDDQLGPRETVTEYGHGVFPDGLEFDTEGAFWLTSVLSNRLIRVTADAQHQLILEDVDPDWLDRIETLFQSGQLSRTHMDCLESHLKSLSSVTFGGPDRKTLYLGNLLDDAIYHHPSPIAGAEPPYWHSRL